MWRVGVVIAVASVLASSSALAQTGSITGTVTSAEGGAPVVGAQVFVLGASAGAITRDDGRYTISVAPGTYTVRARRVGFQPDSTAGVVVTAGGTTTVDFRLEASLAVLSEVVSIGYGEQEEADVTGSVETVTAEEFNTGRVISPEQLIRAKVAGVQVVDNNEPGGGMAVRIRGGTSVNASNEPLYVVDGVPLAVGGGISNNTATNPLNGRNPLNFLNPKDIESITVLKDASATAIYGSRGANGVVIITTRSGSTGPQFSYTGTASNSRVTGGPDLVNAEQFRAAVQAHAPANVVFLGDASTDWLGAIQQDGRGYEHDLGLGGRRDQMTYRLGLNYLDQSGVLQGTALERIAASLNYSDVMLADRLTLRTHLKGARTKDTFTPGSVLGSATAFAPTQPIRNDAGEYFEWTSNQGPNNPIAELALVRDNGTTLRSVGNIEAEYKMPFLEGLSGTVRGGYDVARAERTSFYPRTLKAQQEGDANLRGNFSRNSPEQLNTVFDAYGRYETMFDRYASRVDVTAGYSAERFRADYASFYASGLVTDLLGPGGVPAATEARPFYTIDEALLVSGFGRVNVGLMDRYLFTATVRRDGSSRFRKGNQYGTFPSAAFAWRMLEEPWMQNRTPLSDLKLRVSWGLNGNQAVGNYLAYTAYTIGQSTAAQQFGNQYVVTIRPSAADPDLTWETTESVDVGLDFGFLQGRLTGSIDVYDKKTTDLLFEVPTAAGTALRNLLTTNLGDVRNRGLELQLNADVLDGGERGFNWTASFVASTNRNELTAINRAGVTRILTGGIAGGVGSLIQVYQPGEPINSFFVLEHIRENGKPVYADRNDDGNITDIDLYVDRNDDGVINQDDRRPFHNPAPRWILGHTSNVEWRGFDASTTIRAYLGNHVYNNVASNYGYLDLLVQGGAPTNLHSTAVEYGFVRPQYLSDVYVEDASFVRMDNLTVGYTFGGLANVQQARVFGTIENVFTTTDYTGIDPTSGVNGIDNNIYPRSRTFLAGVSLGF